MPAYDSLKFQAPDYRPKKYRDESFYPRSVKPRAICMDCMSRICGHQTDDSRRLSPSQAKVLGLLRNGLANKEIGEILSLTEGTVKCYVNAMMRRTRLTNRTELAAWFALRPDALKPVSYYASPGQSNRVEAIIR